MFSQKIPTPVPAIDLETFVRLISAPQQAAELFDKYRAAREEYEALRASIAEEMANVKKANAEVSQEQADLVSGLNALDAAKRQFNTQKGDWEAKCQKVEDGLLAREAELADKAAVLEAKSKAADDRDSKAAAREDFLKSFGEHQDARLKAANEQLDAREAAVAAREEKAEQLAKLLKGV